MINIDLAVCKISTLNLIRGGTTPFLKDTQTTDGSFYCYSVHQIRACSFIFGLVFASYTFSSDFNLSRHTISSCMHTFISISINKQSLGAQSYYTLFQHVAKV